jgi:hypothetical protein
VGEPRGCSAAHYVVKSSRGVAWACISTRPAFHANAHTLTDVGIIVRAEVCC